MIILCTLTDYRYRQIHTHTLFVNPVSRLCSFMPKCVVAENVLANVRVIVCDTQLEFVLV